MGLWLFQVMLLSYFFYYVLFGLFWLGVEIYTFNRPNKPKHDWWVTGNKFMHMTVILCIIYLIIRVLYFLNVPTVESPTLMVLYEWVRY